MSDTSQSIAPYWTPPLMPSLYSIAQYLSQEEAAVAVIHKCNLCGAQYNNSADYNAHLKTHFDHRCPVCDYTSKTEGRLKRHVKELHKPPGAPAADSTIAEPNSESDDSSRQQETNGDKSRRDKPRVCKCKHCGFTTRTREEFWEHAKIHIKEGKGLECPRCPFVTEYKHHLEYHLRNHYGSKPFKCSKCNYSCVNKSMLNSHLKSHSNVYQYRCEDCTYATKYCHSLKLHLRKYEHRPSTVLNPDGTPNPYPVIDIYGTRRGPRPKKSSTQPEQQQQMVPVKPSPVLQAAVDSGSREIDFSQVNWMSALTMAGVPVFRWPIPVEVRRALLEQAERSQEQLMQIEPAERESSIIDKVELLNIKEETDDWSEDAPLDLSRSSPDSNACHYNAPATPPSSSSPSAIGSQLASSPGSYNCQVCELDFGDSSMYKIHMAYHGTDNPFKCKVCGQQTADRLEFYVHLTRNPH